MTTKYVDVYIAIIPDDSIREIFPSIIFDFGFEGFLEDDRGIHCYIPADLWNEEILQQMEETAQNFNLPAFQLISITPIENKNWNEEWEKTILPIQVTDNIIISPSWNITKAKPEQTVLIIDPKMTFGTGYHETTRLMLRLMEKYIKAGMRALDLGTGTGILAIAAAKMGTSFSLGVDIDELSLENGLENIERNNTQGKVEIRIGSLDVVTENNFDIIFANIIRNTILELMPEITARVKQDGIILLSGLLHSDQQIIAESLTQNNCSLLEVIAENEWIGIAATRCS